MLNLDMIQMYETAFHGLFVNFFLKLKMLPFSSSYHTLNVDITSPTFTDMNLRYAARRDGVSASVSTPSAGFMGLQFSSRGPYQMRVYGRYPVSIIYVTFIILVMI